MTNRMEPRPRRRRVLLLLLALAAAFLLSSCAAGPNPAPPGTEPAGFWQGLWHGFILFVTFFISLFTDKVNIYEVANTGNWYDFGFFLGAMMAFGGAGRGAAGRRS